MLRYRLYDVERIVATTVTWVLLTTILVATYAVVVWLGAQAVPSGPVSPALSATVGRRGRGRPGLPAAPRASRTRWTGGSTGGRTTRGG